MNKTTIAETQAKENATSSKPTKRVREDKPRKKDEKSLEHVFRALDSLGSTEHKLGAMCQKYAEMYNDHRMLQAAVKQAEKKNSLLQKEKEQLQSEHSKAILTRSRLENLCRELQRQNKAVKEECMLKMREEGEKKREVAAKFHSMLSEIGSLLAQNNNKNAKLRDDNLDMSMRLKSVCDQFEKKEQHVENLAKQMELEMQLADAKLAKAKMEMDIEKETLEKEKQQLVIELAEYKRKLVEMKASELALREQITMYSDKYEEFHKALLQSNSAIGEFKAEMERMTKHIRRLEKETATWKTRYDAAQRTITDVSQGKLRSDEALALSQRRLVALQGICRGLQEQCRQLRGEQRRDSKADEEFRKLEDQIKEVERSAEIDTQPCPRKTSPVEGSESETSTFLPETCENSEALTNGSESIAICETSVLNGNLETSNTEENVTQNTPTKSDKIVEKVNDTNCTPILNGFTPCDQTPKAVSGDTNTSVVIKETHNEEQKSSTTFETDDQKSNEGCVNVQINNIDKADSLEGKENLELVNGENPEVRLKEETEGLKNETNVPNVVTEKLNSENKVFTEECAHLNGSITHESSELANSVSDLSTSSQSIGDNPSDSSLANTGMTGIDGKSGDESSQMKNKKKRKSKK